LTAYGNLQAVENVHGFGKGFGFAFVRARPETRLRLEKGLTFSEP
jgi:hypothetical protein